MSNEELEKIGYHAMLNYLQSYFDRGHSNEIATMLSSMQFLQDGHTADPACWEDWIKAFEKAKLQSSKNHLLEFKK